MPNASNPYLFVYVLLCVLLVPSVSLSQNVPQGTVRLVIPDGTPVKLHLSRTISSAHAQKGDRLDFVVVKDVIVGGRTIIQAGTMASGSVVGVKGKRFLGIGGNVVIKLDSVELITGDEVALRARKEIKGGSRTKLMVAGMIAMGLVYLPAAPAFLLSRGRDSTVLKGTEVTAYMNGERLVQGAGLLEAKPDSSELSQMMNFLPSRTFNGEGHEGDMLNLIFIATREDLEGAFERAGWVTTETSKPVIVWHLLTQRNHYTKLPMATLYVFGRAQTYSYALPDPDCIVTRRHHLRIWKTDYKVDGTPVWVGAATHDVAIAIEMKKLRITHKIDPQVDAERDFVAGDLAETSVVTHLEYVDGANPVFKAETATGETYYSDSRLLLLELGQMKSGNAGTPLDASAMKVWSGIAPVAVNSRRFAQ